MASLNSIGGIHYEMMKRCYNEKSVMYRNYGAKGITVCNEWHDKEIFKKWALKNGYKKGLRLERIDTKDDYCPSNCRFGRNNAYKNGISKKTRKTHNERMSAMLKNDIPQNYRDLRIYRIWAGMKSRCSNPKSSHYFNYGGRGIKVCDDWNKKYGFFEFYRWAMNNGYNDKLSIDRIDNNKGYSPNNCRWATISEQINNRRKTFKVIYKGEERTLSSVAKELGIKYGLLYSRIAIKNMNINEALKDLSVE